ncbi:MAG: ArsR family transcriptional regulator [Candidatus Omnitrophota bacterium]|jgi:ArsR family transcriptional regulator, arsenate/arsenite/antimonite-responsive transcriptional repressor
MELQDAVKSLAALAQGTRLEVFRALVKSGEEGIAAGALAEELAIPANTLSFHLKELANAGLVRPRREGRSIFYHLEIGSVRELLGFLMEDCCQGNPELCLPFTTAACGEKAGC